ncbi:MAG: squalene synthase HpnC [Dehalococcoidia bacterium]|nr:squalene synthase HpnC [Dehalococcoidia bacterium]
MTAVKSGKAFGALPAGPVSSEQAYQLCLALVRAHYENFSVATRFLPRELLPHMAAVYAFCRTVDDLGDEAEGDRLALLDGWETDLLRCYSGVPQHPYLVALQQTIRAFDIPREPFLRLVQANRMDQTTKRYPTFTDVLSYCEHSANPVGHLVLYVFGYRDQERQRLADNTCTALQLANFWQDVRRDYAVGRIYLPREDMARFGCAEDELARGVASLALRELMAFEVQRARELFVKGLPLVGMVAGKLKLDLALFSRGGMSILDAIERQQNDVLRKRPQVTAGRKAWLFLRTYLDLRLGRLG